MTTTPETPAAGGVPVAPPGARFDPVTGAELSAGAAAGGERRQSYALQPGEPVASFNLVTSLMPLASGSAPQTYRWALGLGILIPVVAGALGFLAFAFVAAAVVVPAIYVVYMYDVNQWEDQPLGVVLGAIGAAAALGVGFTFLWHAGLLGGNISSVDFDGNGAGGVRWSSLLVLVLLVPIVSEVLKQVGPLVLAGRPAFDDMIDGLTFGVAAGAAFAAAETIVVNRGLFSSFGQIDSPNAGFWVSLILSAAVVKPIVYGAATGIAVASFSGLGAGYDGFKPATSAAWPRRSSPTSSSRAACSSPPGSRAPRVRWSAWCGARSSRPRSWSGCATCCTSRCSRPPSRRRRPAPSSRTPRTGRRTAPRARCRCCTARTSASPAARRCAPAAR